MAVRVQRKRERGRSLRKWKKGGDDDIEYRYDQKYKQLCERKKEKERERLLEEVKRV